MAKPTVRVRIGFSDGPYSTAPTWTDVTSYVRSITTSRGRTDDWQNFDTGNATVVLDNRDRRYDPTYSSGPYYGNLLPRRQIRIDATVDSGVTYYDIFRGFIDGWPVNLTNAGFDSTVTVTCYDALGLLAQENAPVDWSDAYILTLSPTNYWKLDDTINPSQIPTTSGTLTDLQLKNYGSNTAGLVASLPSTPTQNIDSLARGIPSRTVTWPISSVYRVTTTTGYTSGAGTFWFTANDSSGTFYLEGNTSNKYLRIGYDATVPNLFIQFSGEAGTGTVTARRGTYSTRLTPGTNHHIAFSWTGTTYSDFAITILLDGVLISPTFVNLAGQSGPPFEIQLAGGKQQVTTWSGSTLTETQLRLIFQLSNNVQTESTSARFDRIRAQTPFSASLCDTPASPAGTVADLPVGGAYITSALQQVSDSEGGELYASRTGRVVMTNRTYFETGNSLTNQATFGVGGIPIGTEMSYYWSADGIRNALEIGWAGDANYSVSDADSITAYGVCQDNYDTVLSTLADVQNLGSYLVGFGKLPRLIMSAVEVGQALSTAQWATVLGLELLERITVVVDEPVGSDLSQKQLVQQIEHDITPGDWRTRILGSSRWSSYFIIGESLLGGTDLLA